MVRYSAKVILVDSYWNFDMVHYNVARDYVDDSSSTEWMFSWMHFYGHWAAVLYKMPLYQRVFPI